MAELTSRRLGRLRLAAQRLTAAAGDSREAARAVVGVQAQDLRAAALALRSRVPTLRRRDLGAVGLVRTWTVRGAMHLVDPDDLPWLHAIVGGRNFARFDAQLSRRGSRDVAVGLLDDLVELLSEKPMERADLLTALIARGHPELSQPAINILMPWAASQGLVRGLSDGRYRAAQPPPKVDPDTALATMGRRYLTGYGPASAADLASWSGLPITVARRAFAALGDLEAAGDLVALPGTLDLDVPPAPPALLLAAFDTTMLGYRTREPLVAAGRDKRVLPGGEMLRPVVLVDGFAAGTWGFAGTGRRAVTVDWFDAAAESTGLDAERLAVEEFLR